MQRIPRFLKLHVLRNLTSERNENKAEATPVINTFKEIPKCEQIQDGQPATLITAVTGIRQCRLTLFYFCNFLTVIPTIEII